MSKKLPLIVVFLLYVAIGSGETLRGPLGDWNSFAYWRNDTNSPIRELRATWKVPRDPEIESNQLIFLFDALLSTDQNSILQPVLQWGNSDAGGGPYWSIASWYVDSRGGVVRHTPLMPVSAGQTLIGTARLVRDTGGLFSYFVEFENIPGTQLTVENVEELTIAAITLETLRISDCRNYFDSVFFSKINLLTKAGVPQLSWSPLDKITSCGQRTVISNNSPINGNIEIRVN